MNNTHEQVAITAASHNLGDKLDADRIQDAAQADEIEHKQSWKEAFAIHKKAIFWSMALSGALIMEGYDVVVIGSFYGQREFTGGRTVAKVKRLSFADSAWSLQVRPTDMLFPPNGNLLCPTVPRPEVSSVFWYEKPSRCSLMLTFRSMAGLPIALALESS